VYLLLSANHKPGKWRGIDVSCGQYITSAEIIATNTGLSRQAVRTALNKLKATGEITIKATNKFSLITIEKWAFFQNGIDDCNQQNNNHVNNEATNNQPPQQPSINHKQEVKEINNDKPT
jgi:ribonuclease HI